MVAIPFALVQIDGTMYDMPHRRGNQHMIDKKRFAFQQDRLPVTWLGGFLQVHGGPGPFESRTPQRPAGRTAIDGRPPAEVLELAQRHGVRIISINALQKFNLKAVQAKNQAELEKLLGLASALRCTAIVMCPNNDTQDKRDAPTRLEETISALTDFGP